MNEDINKNVFRVLNMSLEELFYPEEGGYAQPGMYNGNFPYLEMGIVSAKYLIETPLEEIMRFTPPRYNVDKEVKLVLNTDLDGLLK